MASFAYSMRVRFCEVDAYGFAWHGHYLAWFEAARIEMLRLEHLTPARLLAMGYLVPVVDAQIVCRRPIKSDTELVILGAIEPAEKALIKFHYRIAEAATGEICATGQTSHVVMNRKEKLLYLLPDEIREPLGRLAEKYPAKESTLEPEPRPM